MIGWRRTIFWEGVCREKGIFVPSFTVGKVAGRKKVPAMVVMENGVGCTTAVTAVRGIGVEVVMTVLSSAGEALISTAGAEAEGPSNRGQLLISGPKAGLDNRDQWRKTCLSTSRKEDLRKQILLVLRLMKVCPNKSIHLSASDAVRYETTRWTVLMIQCVTSAKRLGIWQLSVEAYTVERSRCLVLVFRGRDFTLLKFLTKGRQRSSMV
jgi:hypothetical protein